jgi:hypothetical protein
MRRELEERHQGTGSTMQGAITGKYTEVDPPEYTCYGKEDDEDDYGDYGDEGGDYGDYGDYGEEDPLEVADAAREAIQNRPVKDSRFFRVNDQLRDKYSEVELDNFMKMLNIDPKVQW